MLDPTVTPLFESCDYAAFATIVGKYRHDLLNRQGNVQLGCNIIARFLARLPDSPSFQPDPLQRAADIATCLVNECHQITETIREGLWFPIEEDLLDADDESYARFAAVQSRWNPYDGQAWETLLVTLAESIDSHLTTLESQLVELSGVLQTLAENCADDDDAGSMLASISDERDSAVDSFQFFKDLMNPSKLLYRPEQNRWESTE